MLLRHDAFECADAGFDFPHAATQCPNPVRRAEDHKMQELEAIQQQTQELRRQNDLMQRHADLREDEGDEYSSRPRGRTEIRRLYLDGNTGTIGGGNTSRGGINIEPRQHREPGEPDGE